MNQAALDIAIQIAKPFEGFRPEPYLCPAGIPTIGYGTTFYPSGKKVSLSDSPISEEEAEVYLSHEMNKCVAGALRCCPVLVKKPGALGAIADFCYNLGIGRLQTSTLRRKINQGDMEAARKELLKWVRGGGRVLPGLVARRKIEAKFIEK